MLLEKKTRKARRTEKKGRGGVGHQEKNADKRRVMSNKQKKKTKNGMFTQTKHDNLPM